MTEAVSKTDLTGGELSSMDRYRLRRVLPYMARAYVDGAVPESCYALPNDEEIRLAFRPQEKYVGSVESGRYKVFIWSGDESLTARPLTLVRDSDGIWRATEFSSLVLPVVRHSVLSYRPLTSWCGMLRVCLALIYFFCAIKGRLFPMQNSVRGISVTKLPRSPWMERAKLCMRFRRWTGGQSDHRGPPRHRTTRRRHRQQ